MHGIATEIVRASVSFQSLENDENVKLLGTLSDPVAWEGLHSPSAFPSLCSVSFEWIPLALPHHGESHTMKRNTILSAVIRA